MPRSSTSDALTATLPPTLLIAGLLLVPAAVLHGGLWLWPRAIVFVGAYAAIALVGNLALARCRPEHFRVRRQNVIAAREKKQPRLDALGTAAMQIFALAWLAFIPLDVFALRLMPEPPDGLRWTAAICVVVGAALTPVAVWENRFATPNVQDQRAAGQHVVDTGVYALIRHPIYAGNLLLFGGVAIWLGSWAALAGAGVLLVATVGRILIEEAHLRANVSGYSEYAKRVRSRLIPFVF